MNEIDSEPRHDAAQQVVPRFTGSAPKVVADDRIACAVCVGMMTTWRDYLLNKCYTHTWMCYVPGLPRDRDYPEVLGLGAPNPIWC